MAAPIPVRKTAPALAAERTGVRQRTLSVTRRERLVVVLAAVSGVTDAAGFVGLGGAFSSVMTGNMVLVGVGGGTGNGSLAARAGTAVAAFILGCVLGGRLAGRHREGDGVWPLSVTRALRAEFACFLIYAVALQPLSHHIGGLAETVLLGLNAVALGIQSSAVQRFGVQGLSTTYMTGTLTTTIVHLTAGRHVRHVALNLKLLAALILGACVGGFLAEHAMRFTPLLQLCGVGFVIAAATLAQSSVPEDGSAGLRLAPTTSSTRSNPSPS